MSTLVICLISMTRSSRLKDGKKFVALRGRLLHARVSSTLFKIFCSFLNYDAGIAGVHFTGPQAFSSTGRTPASASAPAIAGLCPSPQNGQLASTIPIHVGANPISEVRGPSGSTSQHPTSYNDGQHPTPSNLNSARTELQHLDSATGNEVPLQSSGQEKQGRLTLKQLRDLAARSQTRKSSSTIYTNAITKLHILRPFLHPISSI